MSYYIRNSKGTFGPFEIHELKNQGITKDTLVKNQYLYQWTKAGEVLELLDIFTQPPPSIPTHRATPASQTPNPRSQPSR